MSVRPPGNPNNPSVGYYYGAPPRFGGVGSGMGPKTSLGANARSTFNASDWHPTVVNMLVLVVLEIVAYGALRYAFRQFHGG